MNWNKLTIQKDARGTLIKFWIASLLMIFLFSLIPYHLLSVILIGVTVFLMLFLAYFFRVPPRRNPKGEDLVTSVADGKVVVLDKVFEDEYLKRECIQVSVYMNFFDVHTNYWPVSGEVTYYKYHPGKYALAFLPKASELNEHSSSCVKCHKGDIFFKQLAGTFARRIVCYSRPGMQVKRGHQCGIIKFGSRIDMYLPLDAEIKVRLGQKVKASETVIAELK
ncbi:MAG: phosphatidylserine decarboxylase family protein [Bacteroidales bacterium]|nr:phosphatidylserine decarboxylase family protein [Bacteroidales bacterium]